MDEVWVALEATLERLAPLASRALNPAADGASVRALELRGVAADLVASHARHDGSRIAGGVLAELPRPANAPWTRASRWLAAAQAVTETERVGGRVPEGFLVIARVGRLAPRDDIEDVPQPLVLADREGALYAAEELLADDRALECVPLGLTWRAALVSLTHALAGGAMVGAREANVDRLVAVTPANDPARAARRPRRPAESLIALLVEAGAWTPPTQLDAAQLDAAQLDQLDRLDMALRKRSPAARARAVLAVLRPYAVDLDERTLAALLADF